ncbi:MAG: hypothetical protein QXH27_00910 [Candidatus Micrarchaeia archaeon]
MATYGMTLRVFFVSLLLHLAAAAEVAFNYTEEVPGFALYSSCSPRSMGSYPCSYLDNAVKVFTSGRVCSKDVYDNIFLVTRPAFTFTLPSPADGTISLSILECYYGIPKVTVSINGRCAADIQNSCYHKCAGGQHGKSVSFPASCFNAGANTLSITGESGAFLAQGSGGCPALSCRSVPLYARMSFSPTTALAQAWASFELLADSVRYTLPLLGSSNASVLRVSLPARASNVSCGNCSLENGVLRVAGASNVSYLTPAIALTPSLLDGHPRDAYFPGEMARVLASASINGTASAGITISETNGSSSCLTADNGSCVLELPIADSEPLGLKTLLLSAFESPLGSRGAASVAILIEANTTDMQNAEGIEENTLTVFFTAINNKHTPFSGTISYSLPADFDGSLEAEAGGSPVPVSLNGSLAAFNASCPEYANCSFSLRFRVKGIDKALLEELLPEEARVGQPLRATLKFIFNNTNPVRRIRQTFANASEGAWILDAAFGVVELEPNASSLLSANASMPGPSECAAPAFSAPSQTRRELRACIRVPENNLTPSLRIRYAFAKDLLADWASAVGGSAGVAIDGSSRDVAWSENASAIEIVVGTNHTNSSLHEGDHRVVFYYDVPAPPAGGGGGGGGSGGGGSYYGSDSGSGDSGSYYSSPPPSTFIPETTPQAAPTQSQLAEPDATPAGGEQSTPQAAPTQSQLAEPDATPAGGVQSNQSQASEGGPAVELFFPATALINEPVSIAVLRQGAPVGGWLSITSPAGRVFVKQLSGGRVSFVFDEVGDWSVSYGNVSKAISVAEPEDALSQATKPLSNTLSQRFSLPDYAWILALALLLPLPVLALLIYAVAFKPRLELVKSVEGDTVRLRLENAGLELWNAALLDIVQEGELLDAGEAKVSDTIFGRVLRWERGIVRAGEGWEVSYRISGVANHAAAELNARTEKGEIKLKSRLAHVATKPGSGAPAPASQSI